MKILINPEWISLVEDLSTEQKAELLMCLLSYPEGESELGIWKFMKTQIDRDADKYQARCRNLSENRQKRWVDKQIGNRSEPEENQETPFSNSKSIESENNIDKEKSNEIKGLLKGFTRSHRIDGPLLYEITSDYDFYKIAARDSRFKDVFCGGDYSNESLMKAQQSLISKRYGQKLTISQIIDWVDQEGKFKK